MMTKGKSYRFHKSINDLHIHTLRAVAAPRMTNENLKIFRFTKYNNSQWFILVM